MRIDIESERLHIRSIQAADKDTYMRIFSSTSEMSEAYKVQEFYDYYWEQALANELSPELLVLWKETDLPVATCSIQDTDKEEIEIGVNVDWDYQGQGIGTEIIAALLQFIREKFPQKKIVLRTKSNNAACRRAAEKNGGVVVGNQPTQFDMIMKKMEEELKRLGQEKTKEDEYVSDEEKGIRLVVYEFDLQ